MVSYQVKYQFCNLSDALHRNITDNFESVSFDIKENNFITVKIILKKQSNVDLEYIDDLIAEFSAVQEIDNVLPPLVSYNSKEIPLKYIVFQNSSK